MSKLVKFAPALLLFGSVTAHSQAVRSPTPVPVGIAEPGVTSNDPRVRREQALAQLLAGQRQMWKAYRLQTQSGKSNQMILARPAFQKAIELDPTLSEAYTALAEIAVAIPPGDLDAAIRLATQSIQANPQNFGGHRLLARFFTIKSRLNNGTSDPAFVDQAVKEWMEVAKLDPRNAEAWAFLSAFAELRDQPDDQIKFLRNWVSSAPPVEEGFYERRMGGASLAPESASIKLAAALVKSGRTDEAAPILSELISDNAQNAEAIGMLSEVVDSTNGASAVTMISSLQQAVFANPDNVSLIDMLARLQNRAGQGLEAVALLKKHISGLRKTNKVASSTLSAALGELFLTRDQYPESRAAFEDALLIRGIGESAIVADEDREFTVYIYERLIHVSKLAERFDAAKGYVEMARKSLRKDDLFSDRQMVGLLQLSGDRKGALALVRSLRVRRPGESGLLRQEASLLTDMGQVEDAVELIRAAANFKDRIAGTGGSPGLLVTAPPTDEFSDLLFISNLYLRADRGRDAVLAANQAISVAAGIERKQIGMTALATAYQWDRNYEAAEKTLREVLKLSPSNPMALNNLGYFLVERDERLEEASGMIARALKIDPKNSSYLDSLGWVMFKLGKLAEAEKYLMDAARGDAESSTIREHLGDVYNQRKETGKAKLYWERALRLSLEKAEIERLKKKLGR